MDQSKRDAYHSVGNHPRAWWYCGRNLIVSAELLHRAAEITLPGDLSKLDARALREIYRADAVFGPSLMLRAFGVEALLKALFLHGGGALAAGGRFQSPTTRPHDLHALVEAARVSISPAEERLLRVLEYWVEEGRYPIQARVSKYERAGPNTMPFRHRWSEEQEEVWQILLKRLLAEGKKRWPTWNPPQTG